MKHETVFSKIYNKGVVCVFSLSGHMMIPLHEFGKEKDKNENKGKESNGKEESSIGTFVVEVLEEDKMDFDAENSYKDEFDILETDNKEAAKEDIAEDELNHEKGAANVNYEESTEGEITVYYCRLSHQHLCQG